MKILARLAPLPLAILLGGCAVDLTVIVHQPTESDAPAPLPKAGPASPSAPPTHRLGAGTIPGADRFSYLAGTTGTVTIPAHQIVTSIGACSSAGGTVTSAPSGPGVMSSVTGPTITVPAGVCLSISVPVLVGSQFELGDGSVFVFSTTTAYLITLEAGV